MFTSPDIYLLPSTLAHSLQLTESIEVKSGIRLIGEGASGFVLSLKDATILGRQFT
jgi:hypothetical protein